MDKRCCANCVYATKPTSRPQWETNVADVALAIRVSPRSLDANACARASSSRFSTHEPRDARLRRASPLMRSAS